MEKLKLIFYFIVISALNIYAFLSYDEGSGTSSIIITIALVSIFMGAMIVTAFLKSFKHQFESGKLMALLIFIGGAGNIILGLIQIVR